MAGLFPNSRHLVRIVGLFGVGLLLFLGARAIWIPKGFGELGHYRSGAINDVRARPASFAGKQVCIEGCLSVPGLEGPVERHKKVCVKAQDKSGKQVTIEAEGLLAVVFQHEIDHLDGILFVDRIKDPSLITIKQPAKEL